MNWPRCAALLALTWVRGRSPTRRRSASSATCWRRTISGGCCLSRFMSNLEARGIKISTGTIVDATIIAAPSSTKNASGRA